MPWLDSAYVQLHICTVQSEHAPLMFSFLFSSQILKLLGTTVPDLARFFFYFAHKYINCQYKLNKPWPYMHVFSLLWTRAFCIYPKTVLLWYIMYLRNVLFSQQYCNVIVPFFLWYGRHHLCLYHAGRRCVCPSVQAKEMAVIWTLYRADLFCKSECYVTQFSFYVMGHKKEVVK